MVRVPFVHARPRDDDDGARSARLAELRRQRAFAEGCPEVTDEIDGEIAALGGAEAVEKDAALARALADRADAVGADLAREMIAAAAAAAPDEEDERADLRATAGRLRGEIAAIRRARAAADGGADREAFGDAESFRTLSQAGDDDDRDDLPGPIAAAEEDLSLGELAAVAVAGTCALGIAGALLASRAAVVGALALGAGAAVLLAGAAEEPRRKRL